MVAAKVAGAALLVGVEGRRVDGDEVVRPGFRAAGRGDAVEAGHVGAGPAQDAAVVELADRRRFLAAVRRVDRRRAARGAGQEQLDRVADIDGLLAQPAGGGEVHEAVDERREDRRGRPAVPVGVERRRDQDDAAAHLAAVGRVLAGRRPPLQDGRAARRPCGGVRLLAGQQHRREREQGVRRRLPRRAPAVASTAGSALQERVEVGRLQHFTRPGVGERLERRLGGEVGFRRQLIGIRAVVGLLLDEAGGQEADAARRERGVVRLEVHAVAGDEDDAAAAADVVEQPVRLAVGEAAARRTERRSRRASGRPAPRRRTASR